MTVCSRRESSQFQVKEVGQGRPLSLCLNHYGYNSDRRKGSTIAVQPGLTMSTLFKLFSDCVVCVLLLKL